MVRILTGGELCTAPPAPPPQPVPTGRECPRCRRVWSPAVLACHHCPEPPAFTPEGNDPGPIEMGR